MKGRGSVAAASGPSGMRTSMRSDESIWIAERSVHRDLTALLTASTMEERWAGKAFTRAAVMRYTRSWALTAEAALQWGSSSNSRWGGSSLQPLAACCTGQIGRCGFGRSEDTWALQAGELCSSEPLLEHLTNPGSSGQEVVECE